MSSNTSTDVRPLYEIAADIRRHWANVNYGAVPYLEAMGELDKVTDRYMQDSAHSIVQYFLSNAGTWRDKRGAAPEDKHAARIKAELNKMIGQK